MEPRLQLILGFDLMRAAIEGDHDLRAAWSEAMEISTRSAEPMPHVWGGALACLLYCASALDEAGLLKNINPPAGGGDFLHSGHTTRTASVYAATEANDIASIAAMAGALLFAASNQRECLRFEGRFARVRVL